MKEILSNPFIEEMYNKQKEEYEVLIAENDSKWEKYAEKTLECAAILYRSIEHQISNNNISKKMQNMVRNLTMAYAEEWEQTAMDYYKLGVVDGFKNRDKLSDILGGKCYE